MSVKALCDIQRIDIELSDILKEKERFSVELDASGAELKAFGEKLEAARAELKALEDDKKNRENAQRENKERIAKDQKRLNEIKKDRQFTAVSKEISDAEKANKLIDMEMGPLVSRIEAKSAEIKTMEASLSEKDTAVKSASAELSGKIAAWDAAIKGKEGEKKAVAAGIEAGLLKRYETIRGKRGGIGVAAVKNEACQACYIQIPPQVYIQLRKGSHEELLSCPHCHRILYFEDTPAVIAAQPAAKA